MKIAIQSRARLLVWMRTIPGVAFAVFTAAPTNSSQALATDRIPLPPARAEVFSPAGSYVLVLSTQDNWKSKKSVGELFQLAGETRKLLWSRLLPQEFGPRYALVGNQGEVVLLDEWINVKSRQAVMVINRQNQGVAQHDFDAVQRVLDVPAASIARMARHGWWIISPPTLDASSQTARVEAGGKVLVIRLADGHLSLQQ